MPEIGQSFSRRDLLKNIVGLGFGAVASGAVTAEVASSAEERIETLDATFYPFYEGSHLDGIDLSKNTPQGPWDIHYCEGNLPTHQKTPEDEQRAVDTEIAAYALYRLAGKKILLCLRDERCLM